jgi:glycosyltransferase involved in cell wall biosynthesis
MVIENESVSRDHRVWLEACSLQEHGYAVCVICPKDVVLREGAFDEYANGIQIYRYDFHGASSLPGYAVEYLNAFARTFWLSVKVARQHGFDIIHVSNPPDIFFLLGLFFRPLGKHFVFDQHDLTPELFDAIAGKRRTHPAMKLLHRLLLMLEWCSYRTADLVIATNGSFRNIAIARGRLPPERVWVVRNGPSVEIERPVEPAFELKCGRPFLLAYVGMMGVQDGVCNALYALDILVHARGRQDISLVLMGEGDQLGPLQALAGELQIEDYVRFTGFISRAEITRYLAVANVGLVPDPANGLNEYCTMVKTIEYMAMGVPVVAFDLAETRFSAQDAALYATPNRVEELADQVEALLGDPELRMRMGGIGRKRVQDELSWEHSSARLVEAYEASFGTHSRVPASGVRGVDALGEEVR